LKEKKMFVTAAAIRFLSSGEAEFSVAGHPPILHFQKRSGKIEQLKLKQVALGFVPRYTFTSRTTSFEDGDMFVMLTDGLTETANKDEQLMGLQPIAECISLNLDKPLPDICDAVFDCACKHGIADDDQTILLIKCLPPEPIL
jgi:serine phosphatase RsbU (regulator of sigma subunit)